MAAATKPIFVAKLRGNTAQWTNSDAAATVKDVFVADATNGSLCTAIAATSTETANDRIFAILLHDGTSAFLVGSITVLRNSGFDGTAAATNLLGSLAACPWLNSDGSLPVPAGWKIQLKNLTQVAAGKQVDIVALGGDYTA